MHHPFLHCVLLSVLLAGCGSTFEGGTYKPMQDDFDLMRLRGVETIYHDIENFKAATGGYPFAVESDSIPVVVVFETKMQAKGHQGNYPIFVDLEARRPEGDTLAHPDRISRRSVGELYSLLDSVAGKEHVIPADPQKVPTRKPCIYVLVIYNGAIDVSGFLHNAPGFVRNLSPYNNKFALTSGPRSVPGMGVWRPEDLQSNSEYLEFVNGKVGR